MIGDHSVPKDVKVNFPAGKGDKDTRTDPRKYREAPLWDHFGPDKKPENGYRKSRST